MYYSRKLLNANEGRRRPWFYWLRSVVPIVGTVAFILYVANPDVMVKEYDNPEYYGYVITHSYSSRSESPSGVTYSEYLELKHPTHNKRVTIKVPNVLAQYYKEGMFYEGEWWSNDQSY